VAYISGTSASETLTGTSGDDNINGNGGADTLLGGGGNDYLSSAEGNDRLEGGDGDDTLYAGLGDDVLLGGAGADILTGGYGRDTLDGGAGNDRLYIEFDESSDTLTGGAGADSFETFIGSEGYYRGKTINTGDVITDFSVAEGDRLQLGVTGGRLSGSGDYLVWYGAITNQNFSLVAGAVLPDAPEPGFASVSTWSNGNSIYLIIDTNSNGQLNDGDVVLQFRGVSGLSTDIFAAGTLTASIGTIGADVWSGTAGADVYFGYAGDDTINGLGGADQLDGGAGADTIDGGDGDDVLIGGLGGDRLDGGAGNDTLYAGQLTNTVGGDTLGSVNTLRGGDGDDILYASTGKDILEGGAGNDLLTSTTSDPIPGDIFNGGDGNDELRAFNVTMDGGAGADKLWINAGNMITGGTGADLFLGTVNGQARWTDYGISVVTDFSTAEGDRIDLGDPSNYAAGSLVFRGAVTAPNFALSLGERYSVDDLGSAFTQVWTWSVSGVSFAFVDFDRNGVLSRDDLVVKFANGAAITADSFRGGYFKGVIGGPGADDFTGGPGDDLYYGAGGDDRIHGGDGADQLAGNGGADQLWGDAGNDILMGGDGNDVIDGGAGDDRIMGGKGADILHGGDGADFINAAEEGVSPDPADADIIFGDGGNDQIVGGASLLGEAHGGDGDDSIYATGLVFGDAGRDTIVLQGGVAHGGDGDDWLSTGDKGGTLYGDAGADSFNGGYGVDIIHADLGDTSVYAGGGADQIFIAPLRAGETLRLSYVDGSDGADTFSIEAPLGSGFTLSLYGGYDADTLDLTRAQAAVTVDLNLYTAQDTGMGRFSISSIENVWAGDFGAIIKGDANANLFTGGASGDTLSGGGGADVLTGGGGNDVLDGGDGIDVATYLGASTNYSWTTNPDGSIQVKDLRAGAPDGVDTLTSIEVLRFSDRTVTTSGFSAQALNAKGFAALFRMPLEAAIGYAPLASLALTVANESAEQVYKTQMMFAAAATTGVASLSYQFFTGKIPTEAGIDFLISPTGPNPNNLNSAYYAKFDTVNRYINFAVNLGKNGEAKDSFAAKYGAMSLFDATREAYKTIFGSTPTDEKLHSLLDTRIDYLAYYGGDGAEGIGTKAAMAGFLLAAGATEGVGVMPRINQFWLWDLADGAAPFGINIVDPSNGYWRPDIAY